jgi:hypothetical protein
MSIVCINGRPVPVFPCLATKAPACPNGFKAAVTDPAAVQVLWAKYPGQLVGVPTGQNSGFDVLDIDPRHGGQEWLDANGYRLPETRTHQTKSGGCHLLFAHKSGLRNSAGKIAPGVDIRGDGGYIIWWPAAKLPVLSNTPIADWPEWLLESLKPRWEEFQPTPTTLQCNDKYTAAALRRAAEAVARAPEGQRNCTLNREAFSLMRFVGAGLSPNTIASALASAALAAGLDRNEITKTLASAIRARNAA